MSATPWPAGYVPSFTNNYCSNEIIVTGLTMDEVCPFLNSPSRWPTYYANSADIRFYDGKAPELTPGARFYFSTFGFPLETQCGKPAQDLAKAQPNLMINGHQDWLNGLVQATREGKQS